MMLNNGLNVTEESQYLHDLNFTAYVFILIYIKLKYHFEHARIANLRWKFNDHYIQKVYSCICLPPLQAMLLSSDGQTLVTGGDNGVVEVWQACDFKQLYIYPGCDAGIRAMDLSHDQRFGMNIQTVIHKTI